MLTCLVDSHVHLYDTFSPKRFLEAASKTIEKQAVRAGLAADTPGVMMLAQTSTERPAVEVFDPPPPGWDIHTVDQHGSLRLFAANRPDLFFISGRQIVTSEGLEILGLGTGTAPVDGGTTADTIAAVRDGGGLPILPYGVGKWLGRRRGLVLSLCTDLDGQPDLVLGDISGRLGLMGRPVLFGKFEAMGRIILPGSDPLPFPSEVRKVARLVCRAQFDPDAPRDSVLAWIRGLDRTPPAFGRYERLSRFIPLQVGMQIAKRKRSQQSSRSAA